MTPAQLIAIVIIAAGVAFVLWDEFRYRRSFRQAERNFLIDRARRHD